MAGRASCNCERSRNEIILHINYQKRWNRPNNLEKKEIVIRTVSNFSSFIVKLHLWQTIALFSHCEQTCKMSTDVLKHSRSNQQSTHTSFFISESLENLFKITFEHYTWISRMDFMVEIMKYQGGFSHMFVHSALQQKPFWSSCSSNRQILLWTYFHPRAHEIETLVCLTALYIGYTSWFNNTYSGFIEYVEDFGNHVIIDRVWFSFFVTKQCLYECCELIYVHGIVPVNRNKDYSCCTLLWSAFYN